jgi:cyclophilin family peptidyl-prolyl cis-trans isomerase/HEAT repeat protein
MRIFTVLMCLAALFFLQTDIFGQVPTATEITILKAEDARRYDETLEALIAHKDAAIRARAALAAGRIGDDAAIPTLSQLLEKDPSVSVREKAAFAIGEIESIKGADIILRMLDPVTPYAVRARAVEAAGKIAAANAKDPKAAELGKAILATLNDPRTDPVTNRLGLTAVLRSRPAGSEDVVRKFLAETDRTIVADALNTLARLRAKNANRDARDLLKTHVNGVVRANAARVLAAAEDKDAVDELIKAATSDTDSRVRVSAIRALAALKDNDAREPLLTRAEVLFAAYKKAWKPDLIPNEHSEFLEIATTLGRLFTNTRNERAVNLFREFGKLDRGFSPDVYIARLRIAPGRGDDEEPELTHWRQYSTVAQLVGEFATLEPTTDEGKKMKTEAPDILRPFATAYAEADPVKDADTMMAGPDVLQAYARFKTQDLGEIGRAAIQNKDVHVRVAAAAILGDLPASADNVTALRVALSRSLMSDRTENDAQLAIIDAIFKLDKREAGGALRQALMHSDYLVRKKALDLLRDKDAWKDIPAADMERVTQMAVPFTNTVWPYDPKSGTKLGQVLNTNADYRRAAARKNGSVKAIFTTQKGVFTIDFLPEDAPLTVDNFIKLARANYFNGLEVHRVVPNFVMQDGDPRGDGNGGPGWSIRCEMNMVPYERGAVGMALSGKDTGGSQWFVTHSPQPHLDGGYTVFGRVNEVGMKVVDNIVRGDKILTVKIVEGGSTQRSRSTRKKS